MDNSNTPTTPMLRISLVFAAATVLFAAAPFYAPAKLDARAAIPLYHH